MSADRVVRLRPYYYIHVLDSNTNLTRVESGPNTFVRKDHETIILSPTEMINIPPRNYCVIQNPAYYDDKGLVMKEEDTNMARLNHGETEVRLHEKNWVNPFPLYPGEVLKEKVSELRVVNPQTALRLMATRHCEVDGKPKIPGDQWLFRGPGTYTPRIEERVIEPVIASVIMPNQALKLKAIKNFTDRNNIERIKGEDWLIIKQGSYLPDVYEQVLGTIKAEVLTEKRALHLKALRSFSDVYGQQRKAGSEWLITIENSQTHLPNIYERVVGFVNITILSQQQYCVVVNPVGADGIPQYGKRELRRGETQFFLQPDERLESRIEDALLLAADEALLLRARYPYKTEKNEHKIPGQEWLLQGPRKFILPLEVEIVGSKRRAIPLDDNEGIYVRNTKTGAITTIKGKTHLLGTTEVKWRKPLSQEVEQLLSQTGYRGQGARREVISRDPDKAVTYRVPHNAACQIFDYKKNVSRVVVGPEMVMLEPFEEFTVVSLSGGTPKQENKIKSLTLALGPDFMHDEIVVETADHARLNLTLSYNWKFNVEKDDEKATAKLFSVRDFVGDACKALASRVRGAVASQKFDDFHKSSALIIREAVFGKNKRTGAVNDTLVFETNALHITNVDIQSVEPVEQRTRDALAKSVQLAIEITRQSREKMANHLASKEEQNAQDNLQIQKIADQTNSEADRATLVTLTAETLSTAAIGKAKAEANARVSEAMILADAAVKQAEQKVKAKEIRAKARLNQLRLQQEQEIDHQRKLNAIQINRLREEADIEVAKFTEIVNAIGSETIEDIARAGPEMKAQLLEGLGLKGFLVTDGTSPINLFNTANGLVGN